MATIFSRIIAGEIPSYKIAEDKDYFAFLDINPLVLGHTLVVPKQETDYIFTLEDELYQGLFLFAKKIAVAIEKVVVCKRIGIAVIGLEVPHAHIHLVPMNHLHDIDFKKPKLKLSQQEFEEITTKIQAALSL
jgi:histidine triad (HIT) family protein